MLAELTTDLRYGKFGVKIIAHSVLHIVNLGEHCGSGAAISRRSATVLALFVVALFAPNVQHQIVTSQPYSSIHAVAGARNRLL